MARDTGGIIVTFKRGTRPLPPPPQFSSKTNWQKSLLVVSVARDTTVEIVPSLQKTPSSTSSTNEVDIVLRELVRFRSRIFIPEVPTRGMKPVGTPALFERAAYTSVETSGLAKSNRLHEEAEVEGRGESGCLVSAEQHRPTSK